MNLRFCHHLGKERQSHRFPAWLLVLAFLLASSLAPDLHAQKWNDSKSKVTTKTVPTSSKTTTAPSPTNPSNPGLAPAFGKRSSNRFLFAIETSSSMKPHAAAVQEAINQILRSRASGQLFRNDTLGVWTFDSELRTGIFPLQIWSTEEEGAITGRVNEFLKKQRYGKSSRFDELMPSVKELVENSDIITIIIISDGESQMRDTPFDREINKAYQQNVREMGSDRMPVVTVLQGKGGSFHKYTVSALPWPVLIPELPIPLKEEAVAASSKSPNVAKAQPTAPPLIITGTKPAPTPVNPTPAASTTPIPQPVVQTEASAPAKPVASNPSPAPVNPSPANPTPGATTQSIKPDPSPAPPLAVTEIKPPPVQSAAPPLTQTPPPVTSTVPAQSGKQILAAQIEQPPVVVVKGVPEPQPERTEVSVPHFKPESTNSPASSSVAAVTTSVNPVRPKGLLIAAITLLVVALGLVFVMIRRSRPSGPSLITKSMNLRK